MRGSRPLCLLMPALVAALVGCESVQSTMRSLAAGDKPGVKVTGARIEDLSLEQAVLVFDVDVSNPYDVPLPLSTVAYALATGGTTFLSGSSDVQGTVPAKGSRSVPVKAALPYRALMSAVKDIRPGKVVPYKAELTLAADAPAVGRVTLPMSHRGEVPVPAVPEVSVESIEWKNLSLASAEAVVHLSVKNTNEFAVDLNELAYNLSLGGKEIGSSRVAEPAKFGNNATRTLKIPATFSLTNLGLAAFNALRGGSSDYAMRGRMSLGTPFGPLNAPFDRAGTTKLTGG